MTDFGRGKGVVAASATALVLAARRRRKEEEERQLQQAQAQAAAENDARAARKAALWEQLKLANWRRSQESAQLRAQEAEEQAAQRTERKEERLEADEMTFLQKTYAGIVKTASVIPSRPAAPSRPPWKQPLYPDPETADMTEAERRREYMASAEYQERRRRMVEWEQKQQDHRYPPYAEEGPHFRKIRWADIYRPEEPEFFSGENFVITKGIVLNGGPGSFNSYARQAEESYTGHSYGGREIPGLGLFSLFNDLLIGIRDPVRNWMMNQGWLNPEANAVIFYKPKEFPPVIIPELPAVFPKDPLLLPPGTVLIPGGKDISITAVQVNNSSYENIIISGVNIDLYMKNTNINYHSVKAYPFDYPIIAPKEYNQIRPGDTFRLSIDPVDLPPNSEAEVRVGVKSESGRWGVIVHRIVP